MEEAQVDVQVDDLLMVINVPYVSQVYLIHRGTMRGDHFSTPFESSEVRLMREDAFPWDEIAFLTLLHRLRRFFVDRARVRKRLVSGKSAHVRFDIGSRGSIIKTTQHST